MNLRAFRLLILLAVPLALGLFAQNASASVAANTQIINQATLSYDDGSGLQSVNASVTVTVDLVPGLATLSSPLDQSGAYSGADTQQNYNYTITASGNGPDIYTLTAVVSGAPAPGNTVLSDPGSSTPTLSSASVNLGASVTVSGSTALVLNVPSDGVAGAAVNGIAVGDTLVVSGEARSVSAVTNTGSGTSTITLGSALSSAPAAGVSVFEQQALTLDVFSGNLVSAGSNVTVSVDVTASNSAGNVSDQVASTYTSGNATLVKYVRNVTDPAGNSGGSGGQNFTVEAVSKTYFTGGVTGGTGDVLEYLLVVENTGSGPANLCSVDDVLPSAFVTFSSDAYGAPDDLLYINETATEIALTEGGGDDQATLSGATLTVTLGTGATPAAGGSIAAGKTVKVAYQVTIN